MFYLEGIFLQKFSWRYEYLVHHMVVQLDTMLDGFFKLQVIGCGIILHKLF